MDALETHFLFKLFLRFYPQRGAYGLCVKTEARDSVFRSNSCIDFAWNSFQPVSVFAAAIPAYFADGNPECLKNQ